MSIARIIAGDLDFLGNINRAGWDCEFQDDPCGTCQDCDSAVNAEIARLLADGAERMGWTDADGVVHPAVRINLPPDGTDWEDETIDAVAKRLGVQIGILVSVDEDGEYYLIDGQTEASDGSRCAECGNEAPQHGKCPSCDTFAPCSICGCGWTSDEDDDRCAICPDCRGDDE